MKQLAFVGLMILSLSGLFAQEGIQFEHGSWADALAKAKAEDKMIFMDAYTTWCGPCKWMTANVFPEEKVGEFYNKNFINVKMDMEKGEGPDLALTYGVRAYPSLLFINGEGELIHQAIGSRDAVKFVALGEEAMDPKKQIGPQMAKFNKGERDPDFLRNLTVVALDNYMPELGDISKAYFETQSDLLTKENTELIFKVTQKEDDPYFDHILKNRAHFNEVIGEEDVNGLFKNICMAGIFRQPSIDYDALGKRFGKYFSGEKTQEYLAETKLTYYFFVAEKTPDNEAKMFEAAEAYFDNFDVQNPRMINAVAWAFYEKTKDPDLLKKACKWAKKAVEISPEYTYMDTLAALCYANGKKKKAEKMALEAIEKGKENGEDVSGTEKLLEEIRSSK
ncbi:MAG: DUF255 domain-containing protein [Bacteroidota bacterium]